MWGGMTHDEGPHPGATGSGPRDAVSEPGRLRIGRAHIVSGQNVRTRANHGQLLHKLARTADDRH